MAERSQTLARLVIPSLKYVVNAPLAFTRVAEIRQGSASLPESQSVRTRRLTDPPHLRAVGGALRNSAHLENNETN